METFPQPKETGQLKGAGRTHARAAALNLPVRTCCPLCRERVEISGSFRPRDLACASCGLRFRFSPRPTTKPSIQNGPPLTPTPLDASDLERWLAGEPIRLQRLGARRQLWRWCRKRPYLTGLLSTTALVVLVVAVLGVAGYCYTLARSNQAQWRPQHAGSIGVERARLPGKKQHQAENQTAARRSAERNPPKRRPQEGEKPPQGTQQGQDQELPEHQWPVAEREARIALARQLAADSRQLLASHPHHSLFLAGESLRLKLQEGIAPDQLTEQILRDALSLVGPQVLHGHQGPVQAMAISPDGRRLLTGSCDQTARLWDLSAEDPAASPIVLRGHHGQISAAVISPDGCRLVTAGHDSTAMLWDLTADDPSASPIVLRGHHGRIHAVAFSSDGRWLVTADGGVGIKDNAARLWDLATDNPAAAPVVLRGHQSPILAVAISPDGRWVVTAGEDRTIRLWNLAARYPAAEQIVLRGHEGWVGALAVGPHSRLLASGSYDSTARLWDLRAADPSAPPIVLRGHRGWVGAVAISPDGSRLATGSFDKTVRLWNLTGDDPSVGSVILQGHSGRIRAVAFSPDGRWLVSGSFDKTARLWDLAAEDPSAASIVLRGHAGPITTLAVGPDSRWLATGSGEVYGGKDNTVRLWGLRLETVLESARLAAARRLNPEQRQQLLLEAARRSDSLH